ncbi:MAG: hypothetical protein ACI87E_000285 [Mariniblastus sp.]
MANHGHLSHLWLLIRPITGISSMAEQPVIVQKISWSDLCPWTLIFKTFPVASSITVLVLAVLGVVLTPMGWLLSESLLINDELKKDHALMRVVEINRSPYLGVFSATGNQIGLPKFMESPSTGPRAVFQQFVKPFELLFSRQTGVRRFLYFLIGCVWSIFVWSFVGVAITRVSLLRLTRNERIGIDDAFEFAWSKWMTTAGAIGIPLIAVLLLSIPAFLIGLLMGFDLGVVVAGVLWFVVLGCSIGMGLLLAGLMFGWPLMISSVGCEGQNSFDAMTRAYAYVFQKPLQYALYGGLAIVFGGFCWVLVAGLTEGIIGLSYWSTSWGANITSSDRIQLVLDANPVKDDSSETLIGYGQNFISLWTSLLKTVAAAFMYGLFWCMASAVYLLLRKDVDETEMDEIFISEEKRTYELPPLRSDENGIPQVQEPMAVRPAVDIDDDHDSDASS